MPERPRRSKVKKPAKRLEPLPADTPLKDAAQEILQQRLDGVLYYLPRVARRADEDVEFVHQLRVAARRSTASLDAFRPLLPRRRTKYLRKSLRRLRKALGEARDLDVMTIRLGNEAERRDSKKLHRVVKMLKSRRRAEQGRVADACAAAEQAGLAKAVNGVLKRVHWRGSGGEPALTDFDARLLREAVTRFFREADTSAQDPLVLHEARVEAKRLRYTLELVDPLIARPAGRKSRKRFAELQESLGQISDHAAAADLFERWADDSRAGSTLQQLAIEERDLLGEAVEQFHANWPSKRLEKLRQLLLKLARSVESADE